MSPASASTPRARARCGQWLAAGPARAPPVARSRRDTMRPATASGRRAASSIATYPPSDMPTTRARPPAAHVDHLEQTCSTAASRRKRWSRSDTVTGQVQRHDPETVGSDSTSCGRPDRPVDARGVNEHDRPTRGRAGHVEMTRSRIAGGRRPVREGPESGCWFRAVTDVSPASGGHGRSGDCRTVACGADADAARHRRRRGRPVR